MENVHLIVALGNPGAEYAATRHNAGFLAADRMAGRWKAAWEESAKFACFLARVERGDKRLFLCKPQTYMNASGESVGALAGYYKVPAAQVLVIVDDADLPLGEIRLRPGGGTGGHHGLESVQQHLGTAQFARQRIGIAPGQRSQGPREITGYVLGRFSAAEQGLLGQVLDQAAGQVECWLDAGVAKAMNDFNGAVDAPENERK